MSAKDTARQAGDIKSIVFDLAVEGCRKQILTFSKQLKQKMLAKGVSREATDEIIREAFRGYKSLEVFHQHCAAPMQQALESYLTPNRRCLDIAGRILVEYALVRAPKRRIVHPERSVEDDNAREMAVKGVLPRPFVNYFLVALRGNVEGIDDFEARPVLFGSENPVMAVRQDALRDIVEEHTQHFQFGKRKVDWESVYKDPRTMRIGLELIGDVVGAMDNLGDSRFLKIVQNIQNMDKPPADGNVMQREFTITDAKLLKAGLQRAWELLGKAVAAADQPE